MSTIETVAVLIHVAAMVVIGRAFLYKEEQYTLLSWLALGALISNVLGTGSILINA